MTGDYAPVQKWLHWSIAILVIGAIASGVWMANIASGALRDQLSFIHKSLGATILALMLCRIAARLIYGAPRAPAALPRAHRRAARAAHGALYALLLATPLLGWLATSAYPAPRPVWGLFDLPAIWPRDREFAVMVFDIHDLMGLGVGVIAGIHVIAALWHLIALRDGVFQRMWFRFTPDREPNGANPINGD